MEEVVGEPRLFADPQDQTIIFLRDIDLVRNDEEPFLSGAGHYRSEEHTSELQSLMRISYAVFCLKKKKKAHRGTVEHINTVSTPNTVKRSYQRIHNNMQ